MIVLMVKMAFYIVVSVLFGFVIGRMFANARSAEIYQEKDRKYNSIISEKNSTIIKLKNDLRTAHRKVDAINQGYELQLKLLQKKELEHKTTQEEISTLENKNSELTKALSVKFKSLDDKDEIISLLEKRISGLTNAEKNYSH